MKFEIIKHYESIHDGDLKQIGLQPKMDPVGIWTEGWGHAMRDANGEFIKGKENFRAALKLSSIHTVEDADKKLEVDTASVLLTIHRKIKIELNESQLEALTSFIYNTGGSETLFSLINCQSMLLYDWWCCHYITGQGIKLTGLVYRRKSEAMQFTKGIVQFFN